MGITVLNILRKVARRTAIPVPNSAVSSTDPQIMQLVGGLEELCEFLPTLDNWQAITRQFVFASIASEDQGDLRVITGDEGFTGIISETFFDRTQSLRILGSLSAQDWQARKALPANGPFYQYRIMENHLMLNPAIPAGHTLAFEYTTNSVILASDGVTRRLYPEQDDDTFTLPDAVPLTWLRYWWKKEKGVDFAVEWDAFQLAAAQIQLVEATPMTVDMGDTERKAAPGIFIPEGNWLHP